jgi:uncharacterized protein involved in exopolysaccharide biosynthesis
MTLVGIVRLIEQHVWTLLLVPVVAGGTVAALTMDQPKQYSSSATVHTGLVSGYNVSGEGDRVDYNAVRASFDNLIGTVKARSTLKAVALRLLAVQLTDADTLREPTHDRSRRVLRDALPRRLRERASAPTVRRTTARLRDLLASSSPLRTLVYGKTTMFSIPGIKQNLSVRRVGASDLLDIRYTALDPVLCQMTLEALIDEVIARRQQSTQRQLSGVVNFFEEQTQRAEDQLTQHVSEMRRFGVEHEIINYQEQTKAIAQTRQLVEYDLDKERMRLRAARRSRDSLEARLDARLDVVRTNQRVLSLREQLADASAAEALVRAHQGGAVRVDDRPVLNERPGARRSADRATLDRYSTYRDSVRQALVDVTTQMTASVEASGGALSGDLLRRWVDQVLTVTESEARVDVLKQRMNAFRSRYQDLAPLGSKLSSIEREVDIAENQYLELLHSLNQARMKAENQKMQNSLRVVDAPLLPTKPKSSGRALLVLAAAAAGFFLTVAGIVAVHLLDRTLRTPAQAEEVVGLPLATAYPVVTENDDQAATTDALEHTLSILDGQLLRSLQAEGGGLSASPASRPAVPPRTDDMPSRPDDDVRCVGDAQSGRGASRRQVLVTSTRPHEGKSFVAQRLAETLRREQRQVRVVHSGSHPASASRPHGASPAAASANSVASEAARSGSKGVDVIECPALIEHPLPMEEVQNASAVVLVVRSDRGWSRADDSALQALRATTSVPPLLVLNGAPLKTLDALTGDPHHAERTLRDRIKRWMRLEFRSPLSFPLSDESPRTS